MFEFPYLFNSFIWNFIYHFPFIIVSVVDVFIMCRRRCVLRLIACFVDFGFFLGSSETEPVSVSMIDDRLCHYIIVIQFIGWILSYSPNISTVRFSLN